MRRAMYRLAVLIAVLTLCSFAAAAQEDSGLARVVDGLRETYHLDESNFALSYYNTVTGEQYDYNENAWMVAGSTYKLPLNMYYYDLEAAGEVTSDTKIKGVSLERVHYESIVNSNNPLSEAMIYEIGTYSQYKQKLLDAYGGIPDSEVDEIAYRKNCFNTRFMRDTLIYLYHHSEQYTELLDYMKQAMEGHYFKKYVTDYEIAHKYGTYGGAFNDVGIVYTEQPYILAVFTDGAPVANPEDLVGRINEQVCLYNVGKMHKDEARYVIAAAAAAEAAVEAETEPAEVSVQSAAEPESPASGEEPAEAEQPEEPEEEPEPRDVASAEAADTEPSAGRSRLLDLALLVAALIFGISAFALVQAIRRRRLKRRREARRKQKIRP